MTVAQQSNQNVADQNAAPAKRVRPSRRDFYQTMVIANNGAVVTEDAWKAVVANAATPRESKKLLKAAGMQQVRIFKGDEWNQARTDFRAEVKNEAKSTRESAIVDAFAEAEMEVHPRISSALRTLLPLYRGAPVRRTVTSFRNIIRAVAATSPEFKSDKKDDAANTPALH